MKRTLISFILLFICLVVSAQDITIVKKGDIVKEDGYWVSRVTAEKLLSNSLLVKDMSSDISSLKKQIVLQDSIIKEKDFQISILNQQIESYVAMNAEYKKFIKDMEKIQMQNKILTITNGIGFSVSFAALTGIGAYALIAYVSK